MRRKPIDNKGNWRILKSKMAWFWFVVVVIMQIGGFRAYSKNAKMQRTNAAAMLGFVRTVAASLFNDRHSYHMTGVEAVDYYFSVVAAELSSWDFDEYFTRLCKSHGLEYRVNAHAERSYNLDRIDLEVRAEFARRLAAKLEWNKDKHLIAEMYKECVRKTTKLEEQHEQARRKRKMDLRSGLGCRSLLFDCDRHEQFSRQSAGRGGKGRC